MSRTASPKEGINTCTLFLVQLLVKSEKQKCQPIQWVLLKTLLGYALATRVINQSSPVCALKLTGITSLLGWNETFMLLLKYIKAACLLTKWTQCRQKEQKTMLTLSCFLVVCCFEHDLCQASFENSATSLLILAPEKLQAIRNCRDSFLSVFACMEYCASIVTPL